MLLLKRSPELPHEAAENVKSRWDATQPVIWKRKLAEGEGTRVNGTFS